VVAFPGDVALGIASLITGGVIERHPDLRIGFSHGGGAFAMVLPRLEHGWKAVPAIRDSIPQSPTTYARKLYYDCLVYDAKTLAFIIERFGLERIMLGTDYPFIVMDPDPLRSIGAVGLEETKLALLREGNARRFLGLRG
jgi:aminocarboxymuconate-semialdehyde decarboxylase